MCTVQEEHVRGEWLPRILICDEISNSTAKLMMGGGVLFFVSKLLMRSIKLIGTDVPLTKLHANLQVEISSCSRTLTSRGDA
jgi:hypothetical protein